MNIHSVFQQRDPASPLVGPSKTVKRHSQRRGCIASRRKQVSPLCWLVLAAYRSVHKRNVILNSPRVQRVRPEQSPPESNAPDLETALRRRPSVPLRSCLSLFIPTPRTMPLVLLPIRCRIRPSTFPSRCSCITLPKKKKLIWMRNGTSLALGRDAMGPADCRPSAPPPRCRQVEPTLRSPSLVRFGFVVIVRRESATDPPSPLLSPQASLSPAAAELFYSRTG